MYINSSYLFDKVKSSKSFVFFTIQWLFISFLVGALVGSASAFFLWILDWATLWRESHSWMLMLLPVGGTIIGLIYHYLGKDVVKGNNQLIDEFHNPTKVIPFRMAPIVLLCTVLTHIVGGSAGREGTAVQMGGAISDQFTKLFGFDEKQRKILIVIGISAGFASVFGTPLAGTIFALEVLIIGRLRYEALIPSLFSAIIANYTCEAWHVKHTHYHVSFIPELTPLHVLWAVLAGIFFGLASIFFSKITHFWANFFKSKISFPPLRPFIGGIVLFLAIWLVGTTKYIGLGVPTIVESFESKLGSFDFFLKILFTSFTLGSGFKGGEVTPLFFIGATLGNALSWFIPLPLSLLAGMGFVGVFSGSSNTPIACTIMGIELFGIHAGGYIAIACFIAYLFSGHTGIYTSQIIGSPKHNDFAHRQGKRLHEIE